MKKRVVRGFLVFVLAFGVGVASKIWMHPSWTRQYNVQWSQKIGTRKSNMAYGRAKANRFDLYLPKDHSQKRYGLVVYLHAGGFTSGDKTDDEKNLAWLCQKGYVAAGINYTLRTKTNDASVYSQSNEIKSAIPKVIEASKQAGYPIDKMAIAGGSAGHALAMIYAYRDGKEAPVPVVLTYGAVGPSDYYAKDWHMFGIGYPTKASRKAGAALFSMMCGQTITPEDMKTGNYFEKMKPIAPAEWVQNNPVPTVVAYGAHDKVQPFAASKRLHQALKQNLVDYQYFVMEHSGHGLQNDDALYKEWMETVEKYLEKYMPVE